MFKENAEKQIKEAYPYRLELHAHTSPASGCSQVKPEDVVTIFHDAGYDGIAITNHFYPKPELKDFLEIYRSDYLKALETGNKLGMKVYLGAELRFPSQNNNDYLLSGFELSQLEEMYSYMTGTLENFAENFKTDDMFLLQAHPFRNGMELGFENYLDGVEVFNMHPNHNSRVALAERYARENGKIATAGTDYHHIGHDNLCATRAAHLPETHSLPPAARSGAVPASAR